MQEISKNLQEILSVLEKHKIEFIVVGGVGTIIQGADIVTKDVDVCPKNTKENFQRLAYALIELQAKLRGAQDVRVPIVGELLQNMQIGTWVTAFGDLDILHSIPSGVDGKQYNYDKLFQSSRKGKAGRLVVRVASLKDIVASKRFAGRAKDLAVLPELEELLKQQSDES